MLDKVRRSVLTGMMGAAFAAMLMVMPASAQEKFKVVTTFTVIADIAQNVAGDAAIVESITKPGARFTITSRRRAISSAPRARSSSSGTGSISSAGSRNSSRT